MIRLAVIALACSLIGCATTQEAEAPEDKWCGCEVVCHYKGEGFIWGASEELTREACENPYSDDEVKCGTWPLKCE